MNNVFDQFDEPNVFDQFDEPNVSDQSDEANVSDQSEKVQALETESIQKTRREIIKQLALFAAIQPHHMAKIAPLVEELQAPDKNKPGSGSIAHAVMEPAATVATGIIAEPVSGLAGLAQSINPFAEKWAANKAVKDVSEELTYAPKTERGQAALEAVANVVEPLANLMEDAEDYLGKKGMESSGSPLAATAAASAPTAILALLGLSGIKRGLTLSKSRTRKRNEIIAEITAEDPNADVARYMIDAAGKLKNDKIAIAAIDQGFDAGVVAMAKGASASDKSKMMKMLEIFEKGSKNPKFQAMNRPSDVAGQSIIDRFTVVKQANKEAAGKLGDVAKGLKGKQVDVSPALVNFVENLEDMGVTLDPKTLKLNFPGSDIEGITSVQKTLNKIVKRMTETKVPDAYDVHRMKHFIDEQVTFGKSLKGLGGRTEIIIKRLRRDLDGILDSNFPEYDRVNSVYSQTRDAIDELQSAAGKKLDLTSDSAGKAIGTLSRRILSNAESRTRVMKALKKTQDVALKNGGVFDDDIVTQVVFFDEMNRMFGSSAKTSFQGDIQKAGKAIAQDVASHSLTGIPTGATINWLKNVIRPNPAAVNKRKLEAIRELLLKK